MNVPVTRTPAAGAFTADAGNATGMRDAGTARGGEAAVVAGARTASRSSDPLGTGAAALRTHGKAMIAGAEVRLTVVDQTSYYGSLYGEWPPGAGRAVCLLQSDLLC